MTYYVVEQIVAGAHDTDKKLLHVDDVIEYLSSTDMKWIPATVMAVLIDTAGTHKAKLRRHTDGKTVTINYWTKPFKVVTCSKMVTAA